MKTIKAILPIIFLATWITTAAQLPPVQVDLDWETGKYAPVWESLSQAPVPEWVIDAKFGIYAHWGLYSIGVGPAWTERHLYNGNKKIIEKFESLVGGTLAEGYGYKDLLPFFTAEKYDAGEWAELMVASGARFAGFSIGHHDNFGLWDSDVDDWNAGKMGPKRDLYGEFAQEIRKHGVKLFCSSHLYRHYNWVGPLDRTIEKAKVEQWDAVNPEFRLQYQTGQNGMDYEAYRKRWVRKITEVIDRYMPDLLWFDGAVNRGIDHLEPLAHYFNKADKLGMEVTVTNKYPISNPGFDAEWYNFPNAFGWPNFEQGRDRPVKVPNGRYWSEDFTITGRAWSYTGDDRAISDDELIRRIIDITARGGCAIVSLCPRADGSIPQAQQDALLGAGEWLRQNGEAIFATRMWDFHSDESDDITEKYIHTYSNKPNTRWHYSEMQRGVFRYTRSKDGETIYAITYGLPDEGIVLAKHLGKGNPAMVGKIQNVELLGFDGKITFEQKGDGLEMRLPEQLPNDHALAFKISLQ